ncbi:hypothetical protein AB0D11_02695 [Streptomyces monashensis]|uniref:hypothetical protein n=1 Tax=Streptomyces monashensis TaxID=1678012 RepID=UPI00340EF0D5
MALVIGEVKPGFVANDRGNGTLIPLPPQHGGALGWDAVYLSFGSDFGDVLLRVAIYNTTAKKWRITEKLPVPQLGDRVAVAIQDGDQKVSVGRVQNGATDKGTWPCSYMIETTLKAA